MTVTDSEFGELMNNAFIELDYQKINLYLSTTKPKGSKEEIFSDELLGLLFKKHFDKTTVINSNILNKIKSTSYNLLDNPTYLNNKKSLSKIIETLNDNSFKNYDRGWNNIRDFFKDFLFEFTTDEKLKKDIITNLELDKRKFYLHRKNIRLLETPQTIYQDVLNGNYAPKEVYDLLNTIDNILIYQCNIKTTISSVLSIIYSNIKNNLSSPTLIKSVEDLYLEHINNKQKVSKKMFIATTGHLSLLNDDVKQFVNNNSDKFNLIIP